MSSLDSVNMTSFLFIIAVDCDDSKYNYVLAFRYDCMHQK